MRGQPREIMLGENVRGQIGAVMFAGLLSLLCVSAWGCGDNYLEIESVMWSGYDRVGSSAVRVNGWEDQAGELGPRSDLALMH